MLRLDLFGISEKEELNKGKVLHELKGVQKDIIHLIDKYENFESTELDEDLHLDEMVKESLKEFDKSIYGLNEILEIIKNLTHTIDFEIDSENGEIEILYHKLDAVRKKIMLGHYKVLCYTDNVRYPNCRLNRNKIILPGFDSYKYNYNLFMSLYYNIVLAYELSKRLKEIH